MSKKNKKQLVPQLRFPEFRDTETWNSKSLNKILIYTDRKVKKPEKPYTRLGIRSHGKGTFLVFNELPEKNAMDYLYEVKQNDLIVNITFAWEGAIAIVSKNDEDALVSHRFPTYVFNESEAIPNFVQYIIIEKYFIYKLGVISPGAGRNRVLSKTDFLKLKVNIPKIPEQQKIADCLTSLDDLITAEVAKLEACKAHKKGLMQKLFPAEGKTVPEWRFPEFRGKGDWNNESFKRIYSFKGTNSLSREMLNYQKGSIKNIHYGDIHTKFSTLFDIKKEVVPFINPDIILGNIKADAYCTECDIIFADASEDMEDVGKSIEIINLNNEKLLSGLHTLLARPEKGKFILGFGGYIFKSNIIRRQIQKESQGAKVLGISAGRLAKIKVCFPENKQEQQKIVDCLSFLDNLIAAQAQKIELLKAHKKGLMQGLFPSAEEVSV